MWCAILLLLVSAVALEQEEVVFSPSATSLLQTAVSIKQLASSTDSGADTDVGSKHSFQQCLNSYADEVSKVDSALGAVIRAHPGTVMATSDRTIVLGAGQGDTATKSVTKALLDIGLSASHRGCSSPSYCQWACQDWVAPSAHCPQGSFVAFNESLCREQYRNFNYATLPDDVEAVLDTPIPSIFIDLFLSFPNAKWILTTRPEDDWIVKRSEKSDFTLLPVQEPCGSDTLGSKTTEQLARLFTLHNELVRCVVPPENLFEINVWNSTDGLLHNLARFVEVEPPAPSTEFPHVEGTDCMGLDTCSAFGL